jgi:hypothetical protein
VLCHNQVLYLMIFYLWSEYSSTGTLMTSFSVIPVPVHIIFKFENCPGFPQPCLISDWSGYNKI